MNRDNNKVIIDSDWELSFLFIDEERNKELEVRFFAYINRYFNFDKNDKSDNIDSLYFENKESKDNKNKNEPKVIKFDLC